MGKLLTNKKEIMDYLKVGERALDMFLLCKLPHFKVGKNIMSNTDAIDKWSLELSLKYFTIKTDDQGDE